jgi:hypothetical protein
LFEPTGVIFGGYEWVGCDHDRVNREISEADLIAVKKLHYMIFDFMPANLPPDG